MEEAYPTENQESGKTDISAESPISSISHLRHSKHSSFEDGVTIHRHSKTSSIDSEFGDSKRFFDIEKVKVIIKETINEIMGDSLYIHTRAAEWNVKIVNGCLEKLIALGKAFKYIVTCTIVQKNGAGIHSTSLCHWDPKQDVGKKELVRQSSDIMELHSNNNYE
ncbi:7151_t:CDS:2 [Paraglomus brasilianum]|uniref:7151_t:CDS:1 n=1 Tax=Paraglomus brasilianum TaxID=144538 RepID=A0A9N9AXQ8_9GLOM|nr:7151_t:CDS:2 [Paraglomus brasilianum]